jgi:DNA topoisomerase-1
VESARAARLRYVDDGVPGIRRRRAGAGFHYVGVDGRRIKDAETLARIKRLAIPPAWRDVWICPIAHGHLQASGRDARGRKQYRYHARWRAVRDDTKYTRLIPFAAALPGIRARVAADLARPGLPREKILAAVVHLLETTFIRVGNEEYARANGSYGLTTMRSRHVDVDGATLTFEFRGKSGRMHRVDVNDRHIAGIVRRCQELPGQELFQYLDDGGERRVIDSGDVNDYLREITGDDFTAKDFRTWAGTVLATMALLHAGACSSQREAKRHVVEAVARVAEDLGNTPAVCRKGYIHPAVIDAFLEGAFPGTGRPAPRRPGRSFALRSEERMVVTLLQHRRRAARPTSRAAAPMTVAAA